MSEQFPCAPSLCAETAKINLVLEARRIVVWAGELTEEGEEVGGIGAQNNRAARLLRLHIGVILRARARRSGPEVFPAIQAAHRDLLERIAKQKLSPWHSKPAVRLSVGPSDSLRARRKKVSAA